MLSAIRPQYVCVCCVAGSVQYTQSSASTFPTQDFVNRIAAYTDNVYVTDKSETVLNSYGRREDVFCKPLNGDIVFACTDGKVSMYFSASNRKLKDSEWFGEYRTLPTQWSEQ